MPCIMTLQLQIEFIGLMQSEKTSLMTTPKCQGVQIWQINLCLPMDPPVPEQRWLAYQYTKLGRWTFIYWWTPPVPEQRCLAYQYTKLCRWAYFGWWTPHYQSRDAFHTSTQNLADEPTLTDGPPTRVEMPCIPVHNTWQMNLLWPMDPPR